MSGFGLGVFIYNFVSSLVANPSNLPPQYFNQQNSPICQKLIYYYFSKHVAENVSYIQS